MPISRSSAIHRADFNELTESLATNFLALPYRHDRFINQSFTIHGTLSAGTLGVSGANITLQRSTDNAMWKNVTAAATDATRLPI